MKKILVFLCISILIETNAQVTDYKMSDFKYRTPGFKALGLNIRSDNSLNSGSSGLKFYNIDPQVYYLKQVSTDKVQFQNLSFVAAGYGGLKGSSENQKRVYFDLGIDVLLRQFKPKYFYEIGVKATGGPNRTANITQQTSRIYYPLNNAQISLGIGKGRLEFVSNAQMGLYILEDLKKAGKIKGTVSAEKASEFCNLITQIYNKRIFDFRKRRMYELNQLDSFLVTNRIVNVNDITVFNIISDNWAFAIQPNAIDGVYHQSGTLTIAHAFDDVSDRYNLDGIFGQPARFNGKQRFIRLRPYTDNSNFYKDITDTTEIKTGQTTRGVDFGLGLDFKKSLNLKWQLNKHAILGFAHRKSAVYPFKNISEINNIILDLGAEIGFYPNSRTVVTGLGSFLTSYSVDNVAKNQRLAFSPSIRLDGNYFLNYNSRLIVITSFSYFSKNYGGSFSNSILANLSLGYRAYLF